MVKGNLLYRVIKDKLFLCGVYLFAFLVIVPLFLVLYYIIKNGLPAINWEFLTSLPKPMGDVGGGIINAIVGTIMVVLNASVFAIPLGVLTGIYLAEAGESRLADIVRLCAEILQGIPSIVFGLIAYAWVVVVFGSFSVFSGSVALALMMLPVVVRSTEETLKLIPNTIREASLALGVSYTRTILKVILPSGLSGIMTGVLLGVARISGETAPLLFTAFGSPYMEWNIFKPADTLPLLIFNYATSPYPDWVTMAWGASLILVAFILIINILAKLIGKKWEVTF